jgi:tellurite methyltransferase
MKSIADKWDKIYSKQHCKDITASSVVIDNAHLLPRAGKALDLACGMGANAIFLAEHKLQVDAWDVSFDAMKQLDEYSREKNLTISTSIRDVERMPPEVDSYDVLTVSQFLHKPTFRALRDSLHIDGLLFYQTFTLEKTSQVGPTNPDYLLAKNELLGLCEGMEILVYREEGAQGDIQQGWRNKAMIVAKQKN